MTEWEKASEWEEQWHSNCVNSLNEELKQIVYAEKMGLIRKPTSKTPYNYDLEGKSVLDIGGGAYSLLLKCVNYSNAVVADPLMSKYPEWVISRYDTAKIRTLNSKGEDIKIKETFDSCWIYNVLEHTENPEKVCSNALKLGKIVRVFEWLGVPKNVGHPHTLNENDLNKWLKGQGRVEQVNRDGAVGLAYYGVFLGEKYAPLSDK